MIVEIHVKNIYSRDFPGGGVAKNLPCNCRGHQFDTWSGKIYMLWGKQAHGPQLLSPGTTTSEVQPIYPRACVQQKKPLQQEALALQLERKSLLAAARERPHIAMKTQHSQK